MPSRSTTLLALLTVVSISCGVSNQVADGERIQAAQPGEPIASRATVSTSSATAVADPADGDAGDEGIREHAPVGSWINVVLNGGRSDSELFEEGELLVQQCMNAKGLGYSPRLASDVMASEDWTRPISETAKIREVHGYGVVEGLLTEPSRAEPPGADDSWWAALGDSGGDGCRAEADAAVYGDLPGNQPHMRGLYSDFAAALRDDRGVQAGIDRWKTCMASLGYDYDSPWTVAESFRPRAIELIAADDSESLQLLMDEEVRTAVDDIRCLVSEYAPIRDEVEGRILARWVQDGVLPADLWPVSSR